MKGELDPEQAAKEYGRPPKALLSSGTVESLDAFRVEGYRLAVATGKARRGLDRVLKANGWERFFDITRAIFPFGEAWKEVATTWARIGTQENPVALRVNPDFDLKGSGMKMGGGAKPFGLDAERVLDAVRNSVDPGLVATVGVVGDVERAVVLRDRVGLGPQLLGLDLDDLLREVPSNHGR